MLIRVNLVSMSSLEIERQHEKEKDLSIEPQIVGDQKLMELNKNFTSAKTTILHSIVSQI